MCKYNKIQTFNKNNKLKKNLFQIIKVNKFLKKIKMKNRTLTNFNCLYQKIHQLNLIIPKILILQKIIIKIYWKLMKIQMNKEWNQKVR